jgi:hypothetical protein
MRLLMAFQSLAMGSAILPLPDAAHSFLLPHIAAKNLRPEGIALRSRRPLAGTFLPKLGGRLRAPPFCMAMKGLASGGAHEADKI